MRIFLPALLLMSAALAGCASEPTGTTTDAPPTTHEAPRDPEAAPTPPSAPKADRADESERVTHLILSASSQNKDADAANEIVVSIGGGGPEDTYFGKYRFSANLTIELRETQGYSSEAGIAVANWSVHITPSNFTGGFSPSYQFIIDDGLTLEGRYYRVFVVAVMDKTEERFEGDAMVF